MADGTRKVFDHVIQDVMLHPDIGALWGENESRATGLTVRQRNAFSLLRLVCRGWKENGGSERSFDHGKSNMQSTYMPSGSRYRSFLTPTSNLPTSKTIPSPRDPDRLRRFRSPARSPCPYVYPAASSRRTCQVRGLHGKTVSIRQLSVSFALATSTTRTCAATV